MKFNKKATQLIIICMIMNFATQLSSVFVNLFLWKITSDMLSIAKYNLIMYLVLTVVYPALSYVSKKYSVTLVFRISIVFQILYFACIIVSGENAADAIWVLGFLTGVGTAASANSTNQLTVQFTEPENRSRFLSVSGSLSSAAAMVSPVISGIIITLFQELAGYYVIFAISMVMYLIAFAMSAWFAKKIPGRKFIFAENFFSHSRTLVGVNTTQLFIGIRDGIFGFLINILIFDIVKTEGVFGAATSLSKLVVVLVYWAGSRWIHRNNLFWHLRYSMWLMFAAPIPLFLFSNRFGVASQMLLDSIASPLVAITLNSLMFNKIESAAQKDNLEELLAVKEVWLGGGKVIGVAGFMLLYPLLNTRWIFVLVLVTNLCYVLSYFIYKWMDKNTILIIKRGKHEDKRTVYANHRTGRKKFE